MSEWIKTSTKLPEKTGSGYQHVSCWIFFGDEVLERPFNCKHYCWDDIDGDDFFCEPEEPTHWMLKPGMPKPPEAD